MAAYLSTCKKGAGAKISLIADTAFGVLGQCTCDTHDTYEDTLIIRYVQNVHLSIISFVWVMSLHRNWQH